MMIDGYDYDKLVADKRTYFSVIKNIEIVGEAAFMLSKGFKIAHPQNTMEDNPRNAPLPCSRLCKRGFSYTLRHRSK